MKSFIRRARRAVSFPYRYEKLELILAKVASFSEHFSLNAFAAVAYRLARLALLKRDSCDAFSRHLHYEFWEARARYHSWVLHHTHYDPLFDFSVMRSDDSKLEANFRLKPERVLYNTTALGLQFRGILRSPCDANELYVLVDGCVVRSVKISHSRQGIASFQFHIRREVLSVLPPRCSLSLRLPDKRCLLLGYSDSLQVVFPHGTGELREMLDAGYYIDKKGYINSPFQEIEERQNSYLKIYEQARYYFDKNFDTRLFLLYGTLLGCIREGDFIAGDDDFDVGYVSNYLDVDAVREETKRLVVQLVVAGFVCSFNRAGRLFRLRRASDPPGIHLDIRPVWYESGRVWAHKQASLALKLEDFLPIQQGSMRGTLVYLPRSPELFLKSYYGDGWLVPDPGYSNASNPVPNSVKKKLARLCIRPSDYFEMQQEIHSRAHSNSGRLIAPGLHPLYPLKDYEANCEW